MLCSMLGFDCYVVNFVVRSYVVSKINLIC
jgi:hypothetical protein